MENILYCDIKLSLTIDINIFIFHYMIKKYLIKGSVG